MTKKELLSLLSPLIAANTTNPPGNEYKAIAIVEKFLKKHKISYKKYSKDPKRPNLIARIGKGKPELTIGCHVDVVPAGDGWKTDPFKLTVRGNKIYGRGVCDDKGQLAAMLLAAHDIKKQEKDLKGTLSLLITSDEERGGEFGLEYIMKRNLIKPDFGIIPDGPDGQEIIIAQKHIINIKATALGKPAHGSTPEKGINAIDLMAEFLLKLKKHKFKFEKHKYLDKNTLNTGMISGGSAPNVVPGNCETVIDMRLMPSQSSKYIISECKKIAKPIGKFKFEITMEAPCTEVSPKEKIIKTVAKNMQKTFGKKPRFAGIGGGTDSKGFILKGVPMVDLGIKGGGAHVANESIAISELLKLAEVLKNSTEEILQ